MRIFWPAFILCFALSLFFHGPRNVLAEERGNASFNKFETVDIFSSDKGGRKDTLLTLTTEVASDRESRKRGLSGRDRMAEDRGMLFVLEKGREGAFWMKGMRFSLDLLYFDAGKRLVLVRQHLDPCTDCPIYETPAGTSYVIEVVAGIARRYGIAAGDRFAFSDERSETTH